MAFIAFEGLDGSGKSTLIHGLKGEFEKRQIKYVLTREPGGSILGDEIRNLLLRVSGDVPVPRAEALLYQAARAQHVEQLIRPALSHGQWVLCDRFAASSVAFQSGGRDLSRTQIDWLNDFSAASLKPDLYVLLDLSVEESALRMEKRGQVPDRFEREKADFHERVRQGYLQQAKEEPQRWLVLSAADTAPILLQKLVTALKDAKWLV